MVKMNIALDDIRKQAPEGATHYRMNKFNLHLPMYYKYIEGELWVFIWDDWYLSSNQDQEPKPLN